MKIVNYMQSLMLIAIAMAVATMSAANVDSRTAQARAVQFLNSQTGTRMMASPATLKLTHAERSRVNAKANDYYVFNYDGGGYVIVSGDDRAEEILGYGSGSLDMNAIPDNLRWWLGQYAEQMEYLFKNPNLEVRRLSDNVSSVLRASTTVAPLLTCIWDQDAPFWDQCPTYRNQNCYTGCVATAMAQVMYYWKYPNELPALPAYKTSSYSISVAALPGTTIDWSNMKDSYTGSYTTAQGAAVASLMRYCGQSCEMDYGPDGSGAYSDDQLEGMKLFGYNSGATYVRRASYSDTKWVAMMLEDLQAGRPILYGGDDGTYGHAFVVDGYNGSKFHVNWGWSGSDNDYYAISSFMIDSDYDFRLNQDMLYQVYPEGSLIETYNPVLAEASNVAATSFKATWTDQTPSENVENYTLYVQQYDPNQQTLLTETFGGVTATSDGNANISNSLDSYCDNAGWTGSYVYQAGGGGLKLGNSSNGGTLTTPALDLSTCGGTITVNFNAKTYNNDATMLTISCGNVSQTVTLTSSATDYAITLSGVDAVAGQEVTIASTGTKKRWYLYSVEIATGAAGSMLMATETGDASSRVITGITSKNYSVNNLNEGGSYRFYVEANYTDGSKKQSNVKTVTLQGTAEPTPEVIVDPETLTMTSGVGETATATFGVLAANLTSNVTITLNDENDIYSINPTTISIADAENGATVTVTYAPSTTGEHNATITVSSEGAEAVTVTINGTSTMETLAPEMQPADEAYVTCSSFRADWLDITPEQYVKDYTLYVNKKQETPTGATLMTETFGGAEDAPDNDSNTDIADGGLLDDFFDNAGWTGYAVYLAGQGGVKLGAKAKVGYLTTPALDLTNCGGTVTVKFSAKSYGDDGSSMTVSCGGVTETVELTTEATDYTVVLTGVPAEADQQITLSGVDIKKRFYLYSVTIIAGEETAARNVVETGDADSRVITGITEQYYVVENLVPGATYTYYVEANYINGTKAASNVETVTLLEDQAHGYELGDVNHDGTVSIADVTTLIDYLLGGSDAACPVCSNVNGDASVSIGDVTNLIDMLLSSGR